MNVGDIYVNNSTKEKFKITKSHPWGSSEAVSVENQWDVIGIRQSDIDTKIFSLVAEEPTKITCSDHSYVLYTGFNKMLWYCKWCNHEKEYVNE